MVVSKLEKRINPLKKQVRFKGVYLRIAVVGMGVAGAYLASQLHENHEVVCFERLSEKDFDAVPLKKSIRFHPFQVDYTNKEIVVQPSSIGQRLDLSMNNARSAGGAYIHRLVTFTSGDATPTIANADVFITAGTTAITDFDNGVVGQVIYIKATANITITDGAPIILAGSANYDMTDTDTLTLCMFDDQVWQEVSRSIN